MIAPVRPALVLTEVELRLVIAFRTANEQARNHIASLMRRMAEKFPERQRPTLKLMRRGAS